jgi:prevent-host-death family protein
VTIYGHDEAMTRAKVSELKAGLSGFLARVRAGETVVVCDREHPIARIVPYDDDGTDDFTVRLPGGSRTGADVRKIRPVRLRRRVDVVALLRDDRDQR